MTQRRVLADCEADRRIVTAASGWASADADTQAAMENIKRLLALPYADHPDYREEWRP